MNNSVIQKACHTPVAPSTLQIGAIRYDKDSGALYLNGEVMELTPRELALMRLPLKSGVLSPC